MKSAIAILFLATAAFALKPTAEGNEHKEQVASPDNAAGMAEASKIAMDGASTAAKSGVGIGTGLANAHGQAIGGGAQTMGNAMMAGTDAFSKATGLGGTMPVDMAKMASEGVVAAGTMAKIGSQMGTDMAKNFMNKGIDSVMKGG